MMKVMIIGCGGIAPAHIAGYQQSSEPTTIAYLVDPNPDRGEALKEQFHLTDAKVIADYQEGLQDADIVSICLPPAIHCKVAVDALEAGCHVLLEKPMAPSLAECDLIIKAAEKADKMVSVVAQSRFISNIRNVLDLVKSHKYGKALYSRVNSVWFRGESYYDLAWRGRWLEEGGGCTQNHSIHHIDLLLWTKGMPKTIRAYMTNLAHHNSEEEDYANAVLVYEDNSVAEITSTLCAHGEDQGLVFHMEEAGVAIPFKAYASKPRENGFPFDDEDKKAEVIADYESRAKLAKENHDGQVDNFLRAINGKEELLVSAKDGRNCIEVITAIYQSAISGETITLPIDANSAYYGHDWRKDAPHFFEKQKDVAAFADTTITNFKNKF